MVTTSLTIQKTTPKGIMPQTTTTYPSIKNSDITQEENSNIISKLFEHNLTEGMNVTQYIETFAKIAQVTELDKEQVENYLNKYNIRYFGNINNFRNINDSIFEMLPKIQKLNELQEERRRNTISSEYKSIGNGRFIEKRDNQIYFVELDDNGEFSEQEFKYPNQTVFLKDGTRLNVDYRRGLQNLDVKLNGKSIELGKTISLQDIKDMEIAKSFSKEIAKNVQENGYTYILDDADSPYKIDGVSYSADIDKRTREIDFNKYIADLKNIMPLIPESQREQLIKETTENLLDRTYRLSREYKDQSVMEKYDLILSSVSNLVESDDPKQDKIDYKALEVNSKLLGNAREKMIEKNNLSAAVFFSDEKANLEYQKIKRIEKIKTLQENKKYIPEATSKFNYKDFYTIEGEVPIEELPFHLSGVSTTQPIDTRNVAFSYNEFATAVKGTIESYPQDVRNDIFNSIFNVQMQRAYTLYKSDFTNPSLANAIETVRNAISENVFSGKEIKEEEITPGLDTLNNFKVERAKHGQKVAGVSFSSEHVKNMFFTFSDLIKTVKKSGVRDGMVENEVQNIIKSQLKSKEEEKADTEFDAK